MRKVPSRTLAVSLLLLGSIGGSVAISGNGQAAAAARDVRLVIGYRHGIPRSADARVDAAYGLHRRATLSGLNAQVVTVDQSDAATVLGKLRHRHGVAYAQVDGLLAPQATPITPDDPYFAGGLNGHEWGETIDQANEAWSLTTGSSSVIVAVIDSGVDPTQPDLASVLVPGWNVLTNSSNTNDSYGHGTEVAGVAVASTNNAKGVSAYCWSCRLMPIEVYDTAAGAYQSNVASGIVWAVNHGARVINVSLGGTSDSTVLNSAISYALSHDVAVVAAAGDSANSGNPKEYPAAVPGVVSVAASTQTDGLASYSEWGTWVDVAAPGSQATTLITGGYGSVGGTSIAAPAVAGILGLMMAENPSATPAQLAHALFTTASPVQGTHHVAYGRVDAYAAVSAISNVSGTAPVAPPVNTTLPAINGTAQEGDSLTASTGSWSGTPTSYGYQWLRCTATVCSPVSGATSPSLLLASTAVGYRLEVAVTAVNSTGRATATSSTTAAVATSSSGRTTGHHKK